MKKVVFILFLIGISTISAAPKCNCNCLGKPSHTICAMNIVSKETLTFLNQCQLDCQNCVSGTSYVITKSGECPKKKK